MPEPFSCLILIGSANVMAVLPFSFTPKSLILMHCFQHGSAGLLCGIWVQHVASLTGLPQCITHTLTVIKHRHPIITKPTTYFKLGVVNNYGQGGGQIEMFHDGKDFHAPLE